MSWLEHPQGRRLQKAHYNITIRESAKRAGHEADQELGDQGGSYFRRRSLGHP
jgi:hypothetical protein